LRRDRSTWETTVTLLWWAGIGYAVLYGTGGVSLMIFKLWTKARKAVAADAAQNR
jgi:hypothetical protein